MSRIVKELRATKTTGVATSSNVATSGASADVKTTEDYIVLLKKKLDEQKKELENRTDAINAVQRNFESLSDIYADERGKIELSHKQAAELSRKNQLLVRELQNFETIKSDLRKQQQEFTDFKKAAAEEKVSMQQVITEATNTINELQRKSNNLFQKNRNLEQYKNEIMDCTQIVYELENVGKEIENNTKLLYHVINKKIPLLTSLKRDTNDQAELEEVLPLRSRLVALRDGLKSSSSGVQQFNGLTHDLVAARETSHERCQKLEQDLADLQTEHQLLQKQHRTQQLQDTKAQTDLSNSVRSMSSVIDQKGSELLRITSDLSALKTQINNVANRIHSPSDNPTGQLQSISDFISSTDTAVNVVQQCLDQYEIERPKDSTIGAYCEVLMDSFSEVHGDRKSIKEAHENTINELREINQACVNMMAEKRKLVDMLADRDESLTANELKVKALVNSKADLEDRITSLQNTNSKQLLSNSNTSTELQRAQQQLSTLQEKIGMLENQTELDKEQILSSNLANESMKQSIDQLKAASEHELQNLKSSNSELLSQLSAMQLLQTQCDTATESLRDAENRIKVLEGEKATTQESHSTEVEALQAQLAKVSTYAGEKQRNLTTTIQEQRSQIESLQATNNALSDELKSAKQAGCSKADQLLAQIKHLEVENSSLSTEMSNMRKRDSEVTARLSELQIVQSETQTAIKKLQGAEEASESCMSCTSCLEIMVEPTICHPCGHVFCSSCIQNKKGKQSSLNWCPECSDYSVECKASMTFMNELIGRFEYRKQVLSDLQSALGVAAVKRDSLIEH